MGWILAGLVVLYLAFTQLPLGLGLGVALVAFYLIRAETRASPVTDAPTTAARPRVDPLSIPHRVRLAELEDVFEVEVVGESHRQRVLESIAGGKTERGAAVRDHIATLIPEPDNRRDANAVRVEISGQTVGYLSREDAQDYAAVLWAIAERGAFVEVPARLAGGWSRQDGADVGSFGVVLELFDPDEPPRDLAERLATVPAR